jgi:hypothetical protein
LTAAWWTPRKIKHLQQMAGAVGEGAGGAAYRKHGEHGAAQVEQPYFIRDRLVCDGAQVTRPSIDPYREPVETHIYLFRGRVRLSMPVVVKLSPEADPAYFRAAVKACYCMNVLADVGSHLPDGLEKYGGGLLADVGFEGACTFRGPCGGAG